MLTNVDEQGRSLEDRLPSKTDPKSGEKKYLPIKLEKLVKIIQTDDEGEICLTEFVISEFDDRQYKSLKDYHNQVIKEQISRLDDKGQDLKVYAGDATYWYERDRDTLVKEEHGVREELGCGRIAIKSSYKKETKTKPEQIVITVELTPDYQKDYEIIPYSADSEENRRTIKAFMKKYISKPFRWLENTVGCEINFNKEFYQPQQLRGVHEILGELQDLDKKLKVLEEGLALDR